MNAINNSHAAVASEASRTENPQHKASDQPRPFTELEHKLPGRIGLSEDQIRSWRNEHLAKDQDWTRVGRWIKWTQEGVRKLEAFHSVQLNPPPPAPTEVWAEVTRCNFPNTRVIECREFESGKLFHVRIKPEWRDLYKQKMKLKILIGNEALATTKKPRTRYQY